MKKILLLAIIIATTACSNFKKDYVVVDASTNSKPKWVKKENYKTSSKSEYKYFVSKNDNVSQKLCEKGAMAKASAVVASEITMQLNDIYRNVVESKGKEFEDIANENLEQSVKMYLAGIEKDEMYWEKRKYSTELGAEKDVSKYQCYALIKMNRISYNKVLNLSIEKMMDLISSDNKEEIESDIKDKMINE